MLPAANRCGTVRRLNSEMYMAGTEERDDVMPCDRKAKNAPIGAGLSPTVERMFGAHVDRPDEDEEDHSAQSEAGRASQPRCA